MACVSGIQKHRPGADRTKFQVGLEKKEGRFRAYAGSPDSPSFIDDNVLPVNMPAFTPAQKQSGRTGGRSQSGMGETLKNRSVNHHLVHPDISPGQVILHPGSIFPPPPFHFSSGTGNHIDDHGAGNESMLQQNGQAGACGTMQSPDCNRSIFTIDQLIDTPIQGMHQPRKGSQIGRTAQTSRHGKVIIPRKAVNHPGRPFTGLMHHGNRSSLAGKRPGGQASYIAGVSQNDGNRFLNNMGFHTPLFWRRHGLRQYLPPT